MSSAALGLRAGVTARARAIPAWVWLTGIVLVSICVRYAFARRIVAPWIWTDELTYSELAKSFAETGHFSIRGVETLGYGLVYPLLISPAFLLFESIPDAYMAIKGINSVLMSLAVVPAYFLARRVVRPSLALLASLLTVAVPSTLYAGVVMTENAFYPLYILCALLLVLVLERPTAGRQVLLLVALGFALQTRVQAGALVAAALTAPFLLAFIRRDSWRGLRAYLPLYGTFGGLALLTLIVQAARGRSITGVLGAYQTTSDQQYDVLEVLQWLVYHVAELDLYLAVIGFVPLILLLAQARSLPARTQPFLAAAAACVVWTTLIVAAFTSVVIERIEERNLFYVAPLFFVALLVWIDLGLPRPRIRTWAIVALAAVLPTTLPYVERINDSAQSDTLMLVVAWWVNVATSIPLDRLWLVALAVGLVGAALLLRLRPRVGLVLPVVLIAFYAAIVYPVEGFSKGMRAASIGNLYQGIGAVPRDWIDQAVGSDAEVAALWTNDDVYWTGDPRVTPVQIYTIWQNEFFNRSVGDIYNLRGTPYGLKEGQLEIGPDGIFREAETGRKLRTPYLLTTGSLPVAGRVVAEDERKGMVVRATGGAPVHLAERWKGLEADGWLLGRSRYTRFNCEGGTLALKLGGDSQLFEGVGAQTIVATSNGQVLSRLRFSPQTAELPWQIPLIRRGDRCTVDLAISPTRSPADQSFSDDTRRLGARLFDYRFR